MKRLGYPVALVLASLMIVAFSTTVTAVTLASYSKSEKINSSIEKQQMNGEDDTVRR